MAWADGLVGSSLTPYRIKSIVPFDGSRGCSSIYKEGYGPVYGPGGEWSLMM